MGGGFCHMPKGRVSARSASGLRWAGVGDFNFIYIYIYI